MLALVKSDESTPRQRWEILLGVPLNPRRGVTWRVIWAIGSFVAVGSLVSIYLLLGKQTQRYVYIWAGFQSLWLVCRSIFYHLATETDDLTHMISRVTSTHRPPKFKARMLGIVVALSKHQILVHPRSSLRGPWCYLEDMDTMPKIQQILESSAWDIVEFPLDSTHLNLSAPVEIEILGIISDTVLSSVAWIHGSKLTPMDLYDSIILQVKIGSKIRLVPGARALSRVAASDLELSNLEAPAAPAMLENGSTNDSTYISWAVWITLAKDQWFHLYTPAEDIKLLGKRSLTLMSRVDVTSLLAAGDLGISLTTADDVQSVITNTMVAGEYLCQMLNPNIKHVTAI